MTRAPAPRPAVMAVRGGQAPRFLAGRPEDTGGLVNFWRPGGGNPFRALEVGEPFFFKTHSPHNRVVGGGFFSGFAALPVSEAWARYGSRPLSAGYVPACRAR